MSEAYGVEAYGEMAYGPESTNTPSVPTLPSNVFINSVQLNDSGLMCNILENSASKQYNNQIKEIYSRKSPVIYNTSGGNETYTFNFTIWGKGDVYLDLLDMERIIYDELHTQLTNRQPIRLETDNVNIYFNNKSVDVWIEDFDFTHRGVDGKNFLDLKLNCIIYKPFTTPVFVAPSGINGIGSKRVGSFAVSLS